MFKLSEAQESVKNEINVEQLEQKEGIEEDQ